MKTKRCSHKWIFIDKWLNKDETISYEFFCERCLEIEIINHSWKSMKRGGKKTESFVKERA